MIGVWRSTEDGPHVAANIRVEPYSALVWRGRLNDRGVLSTAIVFTRVVEPAPENTGGEP